MSVDSAHAGSAAEDVAEYRRRLAAAREVMAANGYDALVIGSGPPQIATSSISVGSHGRFAQPRYHRYFSGFHIWGAESVPPQPVVVILPRSGEPSLVVRAGTLGTWTTLARTQSWIDDVVGTYRDDPDWEWETNWGLSSHELPGDVARTLRRSGLSDARIGLVGSWPGIEETLAQLPRARFEPTMRFGEDGELRDPLVELVTVNSAWEIARLERAQQIADDAMRAFMEAAQEGASIDHAVANARYETLRQGSEDTILEITFGTDPWSLWIAPNQSRRDRYNRGDLVTVSVTNSYEGYWMQMPRTWMIGTPSPDQERVFETARRALEAILARIEPGVTGGELWDAGLEVIQNAGYQPRGRLGHSVGFTGVTGPEKFSMLPGNQERMSEGLAFVIHPCVWDRSTGFVVQLGDSLVFENGRERFLTTQRVTYESWLG
jgi:Xaa-Pro aminopeptidase